MSGRHSKRARLRPRNLPYGRLLLSAASAAGFILLTLNGRPEIVTLLIVAVLIVVVGAAIWVFARRPTAPLQQRAGLILDGLSDSGFVVLHDVRLDGRALDYVVFGPPGVTVIRTENGSTSLTRQEFPDGVMEALKELHEDVSCLRSRIKSRVTPLLVTSEEFDLEIPNQGELIAVARLGDHFRGQPQRIDEGTVSESVIEVLRAASSSSIAVDESVERDVNSA